MSRSKSLVSASDIGAWTYCNRSWWLAKVQNAPHQNPERLQQGDDVHMAHGQQVIWAGRLQRFGLYLALASILLAVLWFIIQR